MTTVLFLTATPKELARLDWEGEATRIQDAILHRPFSDAIQFIPRWEIRAGDLQKLLKDYRPEVVHFSSHGSDRGEIILEGLGGAATAVSASTLGKLFAEHKGTVRCVVLNACYSVEQATAIAQSIPCVVGMSDSIEDQMAQSFSQAFYRALADGDDLHSAFVQGALEIELHDGAVQAQVPVLLPTPDAGKGVTLVSGARYAAAAAPVDDQPRFRRLLEEFLDPLQMRLANTARTFNRLRADRQLDFLERPLGKLHDFFSSLDDADPRKTLWMIYIDRLIEENGEAVKLIESHIGQIVLDQFKQACYDYLDHAKTWAAVWQAMRSGAVAATPAQADQYLIAPPFPWQFEDALQAEVAEVKRRAGLLFASEYGDTDP